MNVITERYSLYEGDCISTMRGFVTGSVDAVITDPPYGHSNGDGDLASSRIGVDGARQKPLSIIANDTPEQWEPLIDGFLRETARILKSTSSCCCCCCGGGGPNPTFAKFALLMDTYLEFFQAVVWDKSARGWGLGWRYRRNYEFIMIAKPRNGALAWSNPNLAVPNIIYTPPVTNDVHPTIKPVDLMKSFILWHTQPGDLVVDPFMGSGTTGVAALQTGRRFVGIEINPNYFTIAAQGIADAHRAAQGLNKQLRGKDSDLSDMPLFADIGG